MVLLTTLSIFKYTRYFTPTIRAFSYNADIPVITQPASATNNPEKSKKQKRSKQLSKDGDKSRLLISCKRKQFNHYVGQTYEKNTKVPLASEGWNHKKSIGDQFVIKSYLENPAILDNGEEPIDFSDLGIDSHLVEKLQENNFMYPTNVQAEAIPDVLKGNNVLITSETGNGKTLAFLLPLLQNIKKYSDSVQDLGNNTPIGIIIAPSRELAIQIMRVASVLTSGTDIKVRLALGGSIRRKMLNPEIDKAHLLIGSFGAISKLTTTKVYKLNLVRHVVLDEVDTLLDDSFKSKVMHFMKRFPIQGAIQDCDEYETNNNEIRMEVMSGVQVVLSSATIPQNLHKTFSNIIDVRSLQKISTSYLHRIQPHVEQRFIRVSHDNRVETLLKTVKSCQRQKFPTIIFSNDSKTCDWISILLTENGIQCSSFNANRSLKSRHGIFDKFQLGDVDFLSCTDLGSRGLDTVRARHVINYNFPKYMSDYIHRCGRTGRVGARLHTFVTNFIQNPLDIRLVQSLEESFRQRKPIPNVDANIKKHITTTAEKYTNSKVVIEA